MRGARLVLVLILAALPASSQSDSATEPVIQIEFSHPGLTPSHWVLTLHPDGSGHFLSDRENAHPAATQTTLEPQLETPNQDRDIHLSATFSDHLFQVAREESYFNKDCESHLKVAFQGSKKLSYSGADGHGACTFNYANDKEMRALADSLMTVSATILEGARLEMLLRFDRLGLDKETEYMVIASHGGQLQQLCAIRGILERLADDPMVMERVRKRARELLAREEK
jgi:hypothetical protein